MMIWTFLSAFSAALIIMALPERRASWAKWIALAAAGTGCVISIAGCLLYSRREEAYQFVLKLDWVPSLGISFHLGVDGISMLLLLLTGLVATAGVLFSWNVTCRPRAFFVAYLIIIGGVYGVFQSFDLFLLFVFYEIVIVPKYFLIAIWGSTEKEYGAMKLTLYSIVSSAFVLLGILALYVASGTGSFDLFVLRDALYPQSFQRWAFPVLFLGFGVLAGLWPFHTWAPTGHVAAPTAASMLLAGVVMKLGAYGALRVAMPLLPDGLDFWRTGIVALAGTGIVYGAFVALSQRDLKFVIGYSSISHMGFVLLGLMTLNSIGLSGAVLQMFSHGLIAGLLFAVVGRMVYDRTHTRDLDSLGRLDPGSAMPFACGVFIVASAASMGLPGFSGFIAEISILIGAWRAFPWLVLVGVGGIFLTGAFSFRALQNGFLTRTDIEDTNGSEALPPITIPEIAGAMLLLVVVVGAGLYPQPFVELIHRGLETPYLQNLFQP